MNISSDKLKILIRELEGIQRQPYPPTGDQYFDRFELGMIEGFEEGKNAVLNHLKSIIKSDKG